MKNRKIKWGIIGLGKIANKFATDLLTLDDAELYAVASRSKENAVGFASKYNATVAYSSYADLAKDTEVDAVYIATPHSFHKEHSILCLQHKKAVLCEKPFAMNLKEVEEMVAAAKENNVLLMEAMWTYFLPQYRYVLELLQKEKFGKIVKLESDFGFYLSFDESSRLFKKQVGGGSLLDVGIYPIFVALSTLGIPKGIAATANFFENGTDADCTMQFEYEKATASLHSSIAKETKTEAVFTCEKGLIKINTRFHAPSSVTILTDDGNEETIDFSGTTIGYNHEIEHFCRLLREGKTESSIMTFDFSKNLIKTLDKVRKIIGLEY